MRSIVWFCVNLKSGGMTTAPGDRLVRRHGSTSLHWLQRFGDVLDRSPLAPPDVIFLQEAKYFDLHGDELLLFLERQLQLSGHGHYRGFLTRSQRSAHHQAIFVSVDRVQAIHHWHGADPDESTGLRGFLEVVVDGDDSRTLWLKSIHLDPRDGDVRLAEAKQVHAVVPMGQLALIAGDFNSITSRRSGGDGEPQPDFTMVPPERRYLKGTWPSSATDGATTADTRALDYLLDSGWRCQHIADQNLTRTVVPGREPGGDLIIDRCLATAGLATIAGSVWVDLSTLPYSDHRAFGGALAIRTADPATSGGEQA
jgi:endonuclease/exonuclease/phosphatase family metal-dependent hydrolase